MDNNNICRVCNTEAKPSKALINELVNGKGTPANLTFRGETVSRLGKPKLIDCNKCPNCGHSWVN